MEAVSLVLCPYPYEGMLDVCGKGFQRQSPVPHLENLILALIRCSVPGGTARDSYRESNSL